MLAILTERNGDLETKNALLDSVHYPIPRLILLRQHSYFLNLSNCWLFLLIEKYYLSAFAFLLRRTWIIIARESSLLGLLDGGRGKFCSIQIKSGSSSGREERESGVDYSKRVNYENSALSFRLASIILYCLAFFLPFHRHSGDLLALRREACSNLRWQIV